MLQLGATSFWEHFDADWLAKNPTRIDEWPVEGRPDTHRDFGEYCYIGFRHSLCHAWGSGPTPWLLRHILGVTPAEPGYAKVSIRPNLAGLKWARGTVPTPHGLVHVNLESRADGTVIIDVDLPPGVERV